MRVRFLAEGRNFSKDQRGDYLGIHFFECAFKMHLKTNHFLDINGNI